MTDASSRFSVPDSRCASTVAASFDEERGASLVPVAPLVHRADADLALRPADLPADLSMVTTVLLAPDEYRAFTRWCRRAAQELGRPQLEPHEVLRGLVARLVADPRLAADLLTDFRERAGIDDIRQFASW